MTDVTGATVAGSVADAVAASPLVVVCVVDNAATHAVLDRADLTGKTVVNLTNGTPAQGRAARRPSARPMWTAASWQCRP